MEPVGNLANVEELDLKSGQRTSCAGTRVATFLPDAEKKIKVDILTPYECEGNPPKGRWDLLQSPPVGGGEKQQEGESKSCT